MTQEQKAILIMEALKLSKKVIAAENSVHVTETTIWTAEEIDILKAKLQQLINN